MYRIVNKIIYIANKMVKPFHKLSCSIYVRGINIGSGGNFSYWFWEGIDQLDGEYLNKHSTVPYEDGSLSFVYTSHFLEHVDDDVAKNVFKEVFRVLKPGGVFRIVVPNFTRFHKSILDNDMKYFEKIGFLGRNEWINHGVEKTVENLALHWFSNYQNQPFIESEKDFKKDDFYRGPPIIDKNEILKAARNMTTLEFGQWAVSKVPSQYIINGGHISTWTHKKIEDSLVATGFSHGEESSYSESLSKDMSEFDKKPSRSKLSIYHEARK